MMTFLSRLRRHHEWTQRTFDGHDWKQRWDDAAAGLIVMFFVAVYVWIGLSQ